MRLLSIALFTMLTLLTGCAQSPVEPERSNGISITVISTEGDVEELQVHLITDTLGVDGSAPSDSSGVVARPGTNITFATPIATVYGVFLFEISGAEVFRVVEQGEAGLHIVPLDFSDRPSGIYVALVSAGGFAQSTKFQILK